MKHLIWCEKCELVRMYKDVCASVDVSMCLCGSVMKVAKFVEQRS